MIKENGVKVEWLNLMTLHCQSKTTFEMLILLKLQLLSKISRHTYSFIEDGKYEITT